MHVSPTTPDPAAVALSVYRSAVTSTGYTPPDDYRSLLAFVEMSGAPVHYCQHPPPGFEGVAVGPWIHVSGDPRLSDRQRMLILAHEWLHWLRARCPNAEVDREAVMLYSGDGREFEEAVARAFERLF